jgi:hypothetical protein
VRRFAFGIFHLRFSHFGPNNEAQWDLAVEPAFGLTCHQAMEWFMEFTWVNERYREVAGLVNFAG